MEMTTVLLLRHGETEANAAGVLQGQSESDLTARGKRQAAALGEALKARVSNENIRVSPTIYASDLRRASDTAQAVADAIGGASVACDPRLRERRLGPFQGISNAECARRFPQTWAAFNQGDFDIEGGSCIVEPGADANGGIESVDAMRERGMAALAEIASRHAGSTVFVVSHGGWIYTAVAACSDGRPVPHIRNVSVTTLRTTGGADTSWQVIEVGEVVASDDQTAASDARNADLRPQ